MKAAWLVIANSTRARLARVSDDGARLSPLPYPSPSESEMLAEWHGSSMSRLAHTVSQELNEGYVRHAFSRLLIVAPDRFTSLLLTCLDQSVCNVIVRSVRKDLTGASDDMILEAVRAPARRFRLVKAMHRIG